MDDRSDAELLAGILSGRQDLFEVIVHRYQAPLYRYALGMLGQADIAADVVQESFIKAYTRLQSCRDPNAFNTWIFRILRNGALDRLKSKSRRNVALEETTVFAPDHQGPEEQLMVSELGREVSAALEALPESQREAFILKHVEGLSYEEMADRLDASVSALKMRVKRAREELQQSLHHVAHEEM